MRATDVPAVREKQAPPIRWRKMSGDRIGYEIFAFNLLCIEEGAGAGHSRSDFCLGQSRKNA
jgi:hypothetical protein